MKTYKIATHKQSGKKFVRNSYASHKTVNVGNVSFSEKLDMCIQYAKPFETKNPVHIKQYTDFLDFVKTFRSLKKADRQTVKIQLNIVLESEYGDYIDFAKTEPKKLAKLLFDLNLKSADLLQYVKTENLELETV
jgi:hypothetical protein